MTDCLSPQLACGPAPAPVPARDPLRCTGRGGDGPETLGAPRGPWRGVRAPCSGLRQGLCTRDSKSPLEWLWPVCVFLREKALH